jgi:hypothetical protein
MCGVTVTSWDSWVCAFCGLPGDRSKEHVLPRWLHAELSPLPDTYREGGAGFGLDQAEQSYAPMPSEYRESRKSLLARTTRDVCRTCNGGWMSALEEQARPILTVLIKACRDTATVRLDRTSARVLARWAVKTAWTDELALAGDKQRDQMLTRQYERGALAEGHLPTRVQVWLARYDDHLSHLAQAYSHYDRHSPPLPCEPVRRYMGTAILLRGLAILVYTGEIAGFNPALDQERRTLVWPTVLGPFPPALAQYDELGGALTTFKQWIPPHSRPFDYSGTAEIIGPQPLWLTRPTIPSSGG